MAKVIVITGAGSGLGRALAHRFAGDGDSVVLLGRKRDKVEQVAQEIGEHGVALQCDVRSADSVRVVFAAIATRFPKIDVLINNAAYVQRAMIEDATDELVLDSFATNVIGASFCARSAIPLLRRGGCIINISSGAVDNNYPGYSVYAASKAALERLSMALYEELQPKDICVTYVRCGQMMEKLGEWGDDPRIQRMLDEAARMGQDARARPSSTFASVAGAIRNLINLPPDLRSPALVLKPRSPNN